MTRRPELVDFDALARSCDRRALADAMHELWVSDLRPELDRIRAPVMLVLPGEPPETREPHHSRSRAQLASLDHSVAVIEHARHLVMLDAPDVLASHVERFIELARRR
jgi:pimeloyl-ACP methyl ester carboxylesterase